MTAFDPYLPKGLIKFLDILSDVAVLVLAVVMLTVGWRYAVNIGSKGTYVSMPFLSRFWMYFPIPLAGIAMIIFEVEALYNHVKSLVAGETKETFDREPAIKEKPADFEKKPSIGSDGKENRKGKR